MVTTIIKTTDYFLVQHYKKLVMESNNIDILPLTLTITRIKFKMKTYMRMYVPEHISSYVHLFVYIVDVDKRVYAKASL